jgi:DNA-binding MarR family transcriptional regulator
VASLRVALKHFHTATEEVARSQRLTARKYDLLAVLHASPGGYTAGELADLADLLRLSRNTTTELVTRAQRKGLVRRIPDVADGRRKSVRPTKIGTRRYLAAFDQLAAERRRLLAILDDVAGYASLLGESSTTTR